MSVALVTSSPIRGVLCPPPSKSAAHRALLCAALAGGGTIHGVAPSADIRATLRAVAALGVTAVWDGDTVVLTAGTPPDTPTVDCGESGSTLRFLLPVFAARGIAATFVGEGRLPQRPLGVYADCLPDHGAVLETAGGLPLTLHGQLRSGLYELPGNVSSQFLSGLLFALPLCEGDSELRLTTPLESADYVEMTVEALARAGVTVTRTPEGWCVPGGQTYRPFTATVEKDWSQAAFLLAAGALGGEVTLTGLSPDSAQGDRRALELFAAFGADIAVTGEGIVCRRAPLHGIRIDAAPIPDLVPVLAVTAALAQGETVIYNAARLRLKESDRLAAITDGLRRLGAEVTEAPDSLTIRGVPALHGGAVEGYNDHRIVMSLTVAALRSTAPVRITDANSIEKSWPSFFEDWRTIGGTADVI